MIFQFSIGLAAPRRRRKVSPGPLSRNEILVICSHSSDRKPWLHFHVRGKVVLVGLVFSEITVTCLCLWTEVAEQKLMEALPNPG